MLLHDITGCSLLGQCHFANIPRPLLLQALQPPEEAPAMPLTNEVAVSVFGRDLLEGAP